MTSRQPPDRQPASSHAPMRADREPRVLRARRRKATGPREERGDGRLVRAEGAHDQPRGERHDARRPGIMLKAFRISATSAPNSMPNAAGRPITTSSTSPGTPSRVRRYASRNRRRTRFRCTAVRTCRLTAKPTRRGPADSRHRTISAGRSTRLPCWNTAWNSVRPVSRSRRPRRPLRRRAVCGPSPAAVSAPSARPWSSSAAETRGSSRDGVGSAETCASSRGVSFRSLNRLSVGSPKRQVNS
jgi:hypothetical protein